MARTAALIPDRVSALARALLWLVATLTVMAGATIAPALPAMQQHFAAVPNADVLVRLVLTVPAIVITVGAPLAGRLVDSWGRKPVLLAAMLLYGVAGAAGYLLDNLVALLASRALLGLAVAGVMTANTTLIADLFEGEARQRFLGVQSAFTSVGGVVFLLLGGWLAEQSWRLPFLVYLASLALFPFVLSSVPAHGGEARTGGAQDSGLPWRGLLPIYLAAFGGLIFFYTIPTQLPFFLAERFGASPTVSGGAIALASGFGAVGALCFPWVKARLSYLQIVALNFVTAGVSLALIGLAPAPALVVLGLLAFGTSSGIVAPNVSVWLTNIVPPQGRGRALGLLTASIFLGQFASPIISQPLAGRAGLSGMYMALGGLALLVGVLVVISEARRAA
ncbi:MAG TPA: MFS transporter [Roseiflexaceae bacterium]|nr:MFS transporter [Roseiflexaceae bacterium]